MRASAPDWPKLRAVPSPTYQARAEALAKAIDLGIAVYTQHPPRAVRGLPFPSAEKFAKESRFLAEDALAPEPAFANTKSLAYLEDAFFTFWNESHGPHIEAFWQAVAAAKLPFEPRDIIGSILERGSIRTRIEYEHAVDAEPDLPDARRAELARLIGEYEQRSGAKAQRASALEAAAESTLEVDGSTAEPTTAEPTTVEPAAAEAAEAPKRPTAKKAPAKRIATKKAAVDAPVEEVAEKKAPAKKAATKKAAATKKVAAKKPAAKKAAAKKKVAAKKPATKKATTKKAANKKPATKKAAATKKVAAKKAPAKKVAAKKPATKKAPAKKVAAKKVGAKKPAAKKPAKKVAAKKPAAKKAAATKKVAAKKARR